MADSLHTTVNDGIMYGPLRVDHIPWEDYKVSPRTVRLNPNVAARLIMNISLPHDPVLGGGKACSPNEGISSNQ